MLCIGRAVESSWVVCFIFPSTFCPPGSHYCLDFPYILLSTFSTDSLCFLALVHSCICQGSLSCFSHIPLFVLSGYTFRKEIFLGIVILAVNFKSQAKLSIPPRSSHSQKDYLHSYKHD